MRLSVGVSRIEPGDTPDEVIRRADEDLYAWKQANRERLAPALLPPSR